MVGATSSSNGSVGYVNAVPPKDGYNTKYLRADGTWQVPLDHTYNVYNKTLTIQKNGTNVATFTSNSNTDVTANISVPTKTSDLTNDSGFLTSHQDLSGYIPKSGGAVITGSILGRTVNNGELQINGGTAWGQGASIALGGKDKTGNTGIIYLHADDSTSYNQLEVLPNGNVIQNLNGTIKNVAMYEDVVPRSGGAVMTGPQLGCVSNDSFLNFCGGTSWGDGATVSVRGKNNADNAGTVIIQAYIGTQGDQIMFICPNGTWTWSGTAVQITSDQRLKQQISEIDDKLLDAWQDVTPCQFKYNDAVDQKGDNARLHTGYVVQQIDEACQKHNIDISEYGLYCHEEYLEETEEVEVTQDDGTTSKETKVIREASEHYSLRYTETLVVECAYLRRENARLKERLQSHDEYFSNIEKRLQSLENS